MLDYEFLCPPRIVFGWGRRREVGTLAGTLGRRSFVVLGSRTLQNNGTWEEVESFLTQAGIKPILVASTTHEPEVADVDRLVLDLRQRSAGAGDFLLALGG